MGWAEVMFIFTINHSDGPCANQTLPLLHVDEFVLDKQAQRVHRAFGRMLCRVAFVILHGH